ncbi:MAG: GAF domain-containing protein [Cyanobacteriota bacterium]|nr:GAF domain-containing protein [Cyanobacteriota bacterium]
MWELLKTIFSPSQYMPHGNCYLWQTPLVWLHAVSDFLIAIAYFSIPAMLIYFIIKRQDAPFLWIFGLFGAFIVLCGTGHLLEIWTLWHPAYWLSGVEQALTALVSCYTAGQMVTLLPKFLSLKTPDQLEAINRELEKEIAERRRTEATLQTIVTGTASVTGKEFFPALVENLAKALDVPYVIVSQVAGEPPEKMQTLAVWAGDRLIDNVEFPLPGSPCGEVVNKNQTCRYSDNIQDLFPESSLLKEIDAASYVGVPLFNAEGQPFGNLSVLDTKARSIDENTQALIDVFAARAAAELQRQWAEEEKNRAYDQLEIRVQERTAEVEQASYLLMDANAALTAEVQVRTAAESALRSSDARLRKQQIALLEVAKTESIHEGNLDLALKEITRVATRSLEVERASVWFYNKDRSSLGCACLYETTPKRYSQDMKLLAVDYPNYFQALELGETIVADDAQGDPRIADFSESYLKPLSISSMLDVPISVKGETAGVLCLEHTGEKRNWQIEEQNFASYLAYSLSLAIESRDRLQAEVAVWEMAQRERAVSTIVQRMRQTLELSSIFDTTTAELRETIQCDRVAVYSFNPDWSGEFIAESVGDGWKPLVGKEDGALENDYCTVKDLKTASLLSVKDTYLQETEGGGYDRGLNYLVVEDIYRAGFNSCYIELLEEFQAKAYVIVPIFRGDRLWGLLGIYENTEPRHWKTSEINIAVQVGSQLGVAVQQAELLVQTQRQSAALERAVIAADAANRSKSEFLANMSHELRTPLNAILGFAQVIERDSDLSHEHREQIRIINRAGEHLLSLINDILEMSKIEAGRTTINENSFDLYDLLDTIEEMFKIKAKSKSLRLIFERREEVPQYIKGDEGKVRQVLMNLLSNAIKFTHSGGVALRLGIKDPEAAANNEANSPFSLRFEVEDTGVGIAPEEMSQLFEAFVQTDSGRISQQGTGLGLPISQKFVELMGGEITVESEVDRGSIFAFYIKVKLGSASEVSRPQGQRKVIGLAADQPEYRILIVEDIKENRMVLQQLLGSIGFDVRAVENGKEGVAMWKSWQPHLIWMDMRMPIMDGYEATKQIKAHPKGHKSVIIALTASAFEQERQIVKEAGCDDYMPKPFRQELLLAKMEEHLGVRYLYDEPQEEIAVNSHTNGETHQEEDVEVYLSQMPSEWLERVNLAASECSDDKILELLEEVSQESSPLVSFIADKANNFRFDEIIELTQPLTINS